ncbi:MAG: gliding motility-associated C-terminal domain-containing protein [Bacteroidota bacterium]
MGCFIASAQQHLPVNKVRPAARPFNACGVTAILSLGNDSVITTYTNVNFTSQSTNATSYRLIIDHFAYPLNTEANVGFNVGLTEVKLVAYNGDCTDTAVCYYFFPGTFPPDLANTKAFYGIPRVNQYSRGLIPVSSGGYLLCADRDNNSFLNLPTRGYFIKTTESGCIQWARMIESSYLSNVDIIEEAADGSFYSGGTTEFAYPFIMKMDANGNHVWSKRIRNAAGVNFYPTAIKSMADGGLVVTGRVSNSMIILRMDNTGTILWQKLYSIENPGAGITVSRGILHKYDHLYTSCSFGYVENGLPVYLSLLLKLDYATGQTTWSKRYLSPDAVGIYDLYDEDSLISFSSYMPSAPGNYGIGGILKIDTSGAIKKGAMISQAEEYYPLNIRVIPLPDKGYYMLSSGYQPLILQPNISYQTKLVRLDSNFNALWGRHYAAVNLGQFFFPALGPDKTLVIAGHEYGQGLEYTSSSSSKVMVKKLDSSGSDNSSCGFYDWPVSVNTSPVATQQLFTWPVDLTATANAQDLPVILNDFYPEMRYKCPDYVDSCSFLRVSGPASICNLSDEYTYSIHKNKACGQPTQWRIPAGVNIILQTDSSVTVKFPAFGDYAIAAVFNFGCFPIRDSVKVTAASRTPPLELGADAGLCPGNTSVLHAGPAFLSYLWKDGSVDSLLTVTSPGRYWVEVTDSCGNVLTDTITFSPAPPVPLDAGPDRIKCNNDTIHLSAPDGFLNYTWSPPYQTSATQSQQIVVNPVIDTAYTLIAEKTPGCFAYDTVRISVFHSPTVDLGTDKSFCLGDSAVLDAGTGFSQYEWSNGTNSQQITVKTAGQYSVIATTVENCRSYDTLRVVNVFSLPVVHLDPDPLLCAGETRTLDAGAGFTDYDWNDGSGAQTIVIHRTGMYAVTITDNNGCKAADTTIITTILPLPAGFLFEDTAICSYGTIDLKAGSSYNKYLWSSGSVSPVFTISQPGLYWLQATDNNNCVGRDSVLVNPKECLKGFYIPTAFTPGNDGRNDIFRPFLFGNIKQYRFTVYNRWGEVVFLSDNPANGWNGSYSGKEQDTNVFAWSCSYQLEGEIKKLERGTVLLIRR